MKRIVLTVLLSLALVFGMAAVSCDNGVEPDIGDKELDDKVDGRFQNSEGHPGGILDGGNGKFKLDDIFP